MGFFIQSNYGGVGNFEVVVPRVGGGLDQWWRGNDVPTAAWQGPRIAFGSAGDIGGASLVQGTFGPVGNFEVVFREGGQLVHTFREHGGFFTWQKRTPLPGSAAAVGSPSMIQSKKGSLNLEVVAPLPTGGLGHWFRNHGAAGMPWVGPTHFGAGAYQAAALIESSYGNLEVVARTGDKLVHWYRSQNVWHGPFAIGSGVTGEPGFVQSSAGTVGNFEVVAPLAAGGMAHWWHDNSAPGSPWHGPSTPFGSGQVAAVSLINSKAGQLHLVTRVGDHLQHWARPAGAWQLAASFASDPFTDAGKYGTSTVPYKTDVVGIHAALLHTGKVLLFAFGDTSATQAESRVLDPATGAQTKPASSHHVFCSGHAFLPDGKLLIVGGHDHDVTAVHSFDPGSGQWTHLGEMPVGRWYPTCATMPNGQVFTISGTSMGGPITATNPVNNTLQLLMGGLKKNEALPSPFSKHFPPQMPTIDLYPFVYVLPSGKVLVHSRHVTRLYDPATHTWHPMQLQMNHKVSRTYPGAGSSVLLPLLPADGYKARILVVGGGGLDPEHLARATAATKTAELLDVSTPQPWAWQNLPSMAYGRVMPDATLLPDGTVLVNGGSSTGKAGLALDPVFPYELFDPAAKTWKTLRTQHVPRLYHSTALLLPDASVLMLGKDGLYNTDPYKYPEHRAEIFKPPYLFHGPRPVIAGAPAKVSYGATFTVSTPDAAGIAAVNLVRPGAATHSFNMNQRLVGLVVDGRSGSTLTLKAPPNANVAPPGHYMLFLLNAQGVPSVAKFIQLTA